jgi:hypothetical protein
MCDVELVMTDKKVFVPRGERAVTPAIVLAVKNELKARSSFYPDLCALATSEKRSGNVAFSWPKGQHDESTLELYRAGLMSRFQTHTAYINSFVHSDGTEMDSVNLRIPKYRFGANVVEGGNTLPPEENESFSSYEDVPFEAPKILHLPSAAGLKIEMEPETKKTKKAAKTKSAE